MSQVSSFRHPLISDLDSLMDLEGTACGLRLWHRLEVGQGQLCDWCAGSRRRETKAS